ncbi:MAG TPA: ribonuclease Y [Planctomycetota bacterium]|nr:ribonuclease Y [Planctomycetota bacterium]
MGILANLSGGYAGILAAACVLAGAGGGYLLFRWLAHRRGEHAGERAQEIVSDARQRADNILKEAELKAKEEVFKRREQFEKETQETRGELRGLERRLTKREDNLDRKADLITKKERFVESQEKRISQREGQLGQAQKDLDALIESEKESLRLISGMTREEAQALLLDRLEKELVHEQSETIQRVTEETKELADGKAREIIATSIQRLAADHTVEHVVSAIDIPNDDMKGRIIGREGRNIRAFERATGVDVIVDDTPGVVVVSGFDSVRREVARRAMERLIVDGRIHPARIEEVVQETQKEVEQIIRETGKQTVLDANVRGVHPKVLELLGRLRYRTSYGQNVLQHSVEVAFLAAMLASELGLDPVLARRCGLLHDIGKAVDHEMEGGHPAIGGDLARRYEEKPLVINAIAGHHGDVEAESIYTVLVMAADAISASRPGARRETLEKYIKRLERLEGIAQSFPGVDKAYAIQAGREVRVIVNSDKINDKDSAKICRDIAKEIETELTYPGEVKVTLIRETRFTEVAH